MIPSAVAMATAVLVTAPLPRSAFKNTPLLFLVRIPAIINVLHLQIEILLLQSSHGCIAFFVSEGIFPSTQTTCLVKVSVLPPAWRQFYVPMLFYLTLYISRFLHSLLLLAPS